MTAARWWWPRVIWARGAWRVWLAPTFGWFGVAMYPKTATTERALSFGVWPITVTYKMRQVDGGDV